MRKGGNPMELKGSKTEKNLLASFAGESQARNRYTYYASVAKKAGYEQIAALFLETADNEKEHAKMYFKCLEGGEVEITASYPAGVIGTTAENLEAAASGEHLEWTKLYPEAAQVAREEGFDHIATVFTEIAEVEEKHEQFNGNAATVVMFMRGRKLHTNVPRVSTLKATMSCSVKTINP
jgi:rubrerythrin